MSAEHQKASVIECGEVTRVSALQQGTHLSLEGIYDEVKRVRLDTLNTLLHYMVTVLVLHTLQHMAVQLPHHLTLQGERTEGHVIMRVRHCSKAFSNLSSFTATHGTTNKTVL